MRIALVIASLSAGGAERVLSRMANRWASADNEISFITLSGAEDDFYELDARVDRYALDLLAESTDLLDALRANLRRARAIRHTLDRIEPDVVVSFLDTTNVLVLTSTIGTGRTVIISERTDPRAHDIGRVWSFLRALFYRRASALVVPSNGMAGWAHKVAGQRKTVVIQNPVDAPHDVRVSPSHPSRVIGMGRLEHQKGFDMLIRAFAECADRHPDWELVIYGKGSQRGPLGEIARVAGIAERVSLPGLTKDPFTELAASQVFVLSSRYEGFANILTEAMSAGTASIATRCPSGPDELIDNGVDGLLVPISIGGLSSAMDELMSDDGLRSRLGEKAKLAHRRLRVEVIMERWDDLIEDLTGRRPVAADTGGDDG